MMLVLVTLCVIITVNLLRSRVGRAWVAIRDNDISAEVMGINVVKYKLLAFFVAGFIGGMPVRSGSATLPPSAPSTSPGSGLCGWWV
jgi:branched-chain amino acid transport system permease protein